MEEDFIGRYEIKLIGEKYPHALVVLQFTKTSDGKLYTFVTNDDRTFFASSIVWFRKIGDI